MNFQDYKKEKIIEDLNEIEKETYLSYLEKAYEDDKIMIEVASLKSARWSVIICYYAMHDITKYYLAKNYNLKITGRGIHLATIVALKYVIHNNETKRKIIKLIKEAQKVYEVLNSPLWEKIIPTMLVKGREEREKSQYYTGKKNLMLADTIIFKEQIVKPYLEIFENLLKKMLIETILGFKGTWRVLFFLSQTPTKPISRTQIKENTYLGNEAINTSLKKLTLSNILIKIKKINKEYYYYNLENKFSKEILNLFKMENETLRYIDYKGHVVLNEFLRKIFDKTSSILQISVFGSYAKNTNKINSDIDIALIFEKKNINSELIITDIVENIFKQFKIKIEPHYFNKKDYLNEQSNLIKEIKNDEILIFSTIEKNN